MKEEIAELLKFNSSENSNISFDEYIEKSKKDEPIYYINGKSKSEVLASPYLSQFKEN